MLRHACKACTVALVCLLVETSSEFIVHHESTEFANDKQLEAF
jgi:hypothetical protein